MNEGLYRFEDNILLSGVSGKRIYESISHLKICDITPDADIDEKYRNIGDLFLRGSYSCGELVNSHRDRQSGGRSDFENFRELCSLLERSEGNRLATLVKLTLCHAFGVDLDVTRENAGEIWRRTAEHFGAVGLSFHDIYEMCGAVLVDIITPDRIVFSDKLKNFDSYDELKDHISCVAKHNEEKFGQLLFIDRDYAFERPDRYSSRLIFDKIRRGDALDDGETNRWRTQIRREMALSVSKECKTVILTDSNGETEKLVSYLTDIKANAEIIVFPDSLPKDICSDYLPYICGYSQKHPICDCFGAIFGERYTEREAVFLPAYHMAFRRSLSSFLGILCERGLLIEEKGMKTAHSLSTAVYEKYIILPKNRHEPQH